MAKLNLICYAGPNINRKVYEDYHKFAMSIEILHLSCDEFELLILTLIYFGTTAGYVNNYEHVMVQ